MTCNSTIHSIANPKIWSLLSILLIQTKKDWLMEIESQQKLSFPFVPIKKNTLRSIIKHLFNYHTKNYVNMQQLSSSIQEREKLKVVIASIAQQVGIWLFPEEIDNIAQQHEFFFLKKDKSFIFCDILAILFAFKQELQTTFARLFHEGKLSFLPPTFFPNTPYLSFGLSPEGDIELVYLEKRYLIKSDSALNELASLLPQIVKRPLDTTESEQPPAKRRKSYPLTQDLKDMRKQLHQLQSVHNQMVQQPQNNSQLQYQLPTNTQFQFQPPTNTSLQFQPPTNTSLEYQPPTDAQLQYQPPMNSQLQYPPPNSPLPNYQPQLVVLEEKPSNPPTYDDLLAENMMLKEKLAEAEKRLQDLEHLRMTYLQQSKSEKMENSSSEYLISENNNNDNNSCVKTTSGSDCHQEQEQQQQQQQEQQQQQDLVSFEVESLFNSEYLLNSECLSY